MFIRLFSDIHNEFSHLDMPCLDTDKDDILILAGDIGVADHLKTFDPIFEWAPHFRQVIQICGNHEFYHGSFLLTPTKIRKKLDSLPNWKLVNNEVVRVDNVSFICGTLWTDFNRQDPMVMEIVRNSLNDYNYIRTGPNVNNAYAKRISPLDIFCEHQITRNFIFESIVNEKLLGQKTVVVTHHGPTVLSIDHARYGDVPLNWAYVSDLSNEIMDTQPDLWVHGHTHTSFDYMMGETRIVTNPRGYCYTRGVPENKGFNPILRLEV